MSAERIVVVGGGLAGARGAEALRARGFEGSLVLVGEEAQLPYERPPLSKAYLQGDVDAGSTLVHPSSWYAEHEVDLRTGVRVAALDREGQEVVLSSGERLWYDQVLLCTGAVPRRLPLPGADLDGVLTLRTLADSDRLRAALVPDDHLVLVGGGWIGLETAAAARQAGVRVTVLERERLPLLAVLGTELAEVFAALHRQHGVDLRTAVGVAAFESDGAGRVGAVRLDDGTRLACDTVLVAVGAAPATELAAQAGLDVGDGVLVDAQLRTSDPRVFAAGDVASAVHPVLGGRIRVEHWANALNQPPVAAAAMLGSDEVYDRLPYFYTDQYDLGMEYTGYVGAGGHDRLVVRGDLGARELVAFWVRGGAVLAGMNVNVWDVVDDVKAVIAAGPGVDLDLLADTSVPLSQVAAARG